MKSMKIDGYKYVRVDENGHFFYQVFLGRDSEGKQRFKKGRKDQKGLKFGSPKAAEAEAKGQILPPQKKGNAYRELFKVALAHINGTANGDEDEDAEAFGDGDQA